MGAHLPLHASALGKALLANHEQVREDVIAGGLPRLSGATVTAPAALRKMLEGVRVVGWAAEREEAVIGEASIAAPIFDHRGDAAGAIGVGRSRRAHLSRARTTAHAHRPRARRGARDHARARRRSSLTPVAGTVANR